MRFMCIRIGMVAVDMKKNKYACRHFDSVPVPCNWVVKGFCGVDACRCRIVVRIVG